MRDAPCAALAFVPAGTTLVRGTYGALLLGERRLSLPLDQVHALAFSADAQALAVAGGTPGVLGRVCVLEWPRGRLVKRVELHRDLVVAVAFSPKAGLLATGSHDGTARCGERSLEGPVGPVLDVAFSSEGSELVTACADGALRVYDPVTATLTRTLSQHTDRVHAVVFLPGSARCASASADKTVRLWQPSTGRMIRIIRGFDGAVLCLAGSPDGARLYTGGEEGIVRVVDTQSDRVLQAWRASAHWLLRLALSPDGRTLATGDSAGGIRLWDALTGAPRPASGAGGTQRPWAGQR